MQHPNEVKETIDLDFLAAQSEKFDKATGEIADKMLNQKMTPKESMGLSSAYLENIYSQAFSLYNTGKYIEAAHLFRILIMYNPMEPKYMMGLAACFHLLKEWDSAIQMYTLCSALDPNTPIPHYHTSDCFIQMNDDLSAMLCLELAIEKAEGKAEFSKIKERALLSLENLRKHKS